MSTEKKDLKVERPSEFSGSRMWVARPTDPQKKVKRLLEIRGYVRAGLMTEAQTQKIFDAMIFDPANPHTLMGFYVKPTDPKHAGTFTDEDGKYLGDCQTGDSLVNEELRAKLKT